jgi:CRP-like cAMP-binding protein
MSRAPTRDLLDDRYDEIAAPLISRLVAFLSLGRRTFGDLDRLLILYVICERSRPDAAGRRPARPWTNIRSIAESTGLPRETVRRKVAQLAAEGLVSRDGNRLTLLPAIANVAGPTRAALLDMAAGHADLAERLRAQREAA